MRRHAYLSERCHRRGVEHEQIRLVELAVVRGRHQQAVVLLRGSGAGDEEGLAWEVIWPPPGDDRLGLVADVLLDKR